MTHMQHFTIGLYQICGDVIKRINNILYQKKINANLTICNFAKHDGIYNLSNNFN